MVQPDLDNFLLLVLIFLLTGDTSFFVFFLFFFQPTVLYDAISISTVEE